MSIHLMKMERSSEEKLAFSSKMLKSSKLIEETISLKNRKKHSNALILKILKLQKARLSQKRLTEEFALNHSLTISLMTTKLMNCSKRERKVITSLMIMFLSSVELSELTCSAKAIIISRIHS